MRSVLVMGGRFTCRLRTMSCCRKSAFSAMSWDLLFPRSVRVASSDEVPNGFVQRVKRAERAVLATSDIQREKYGFPFQ
jgi:hypothetical protein